MLRDMKAAGGSLMEDARLFDVYRSPLLGSDRKSVAFSFVLRSTDHTLTEAEITAVMENITKLACDRYGAVIRT